ncbi:integrase, partial [Halorubrum sp. AD140]|uniref:tyrosine-type recombinase/integrase n=1 Tax=Halorubrum sp. AD140 TaxID=3050073 RepID=UPI002ACCC8AB
MMYDEKLDPIGPREARDDYLKERQEDASFETLRTIRKGLNLFVEWCVEKGIGNMNDVRGRQLNKFKNWCKDTSDNSTVSLNGILSVLRRFLVYCVRIEAVASGTPDKTPIPNVPDDEDVNYEKPTDEEVEAARKYLETYESASRRHVEYRIVEEIGCRVGAVRAIDVGDVNLEDRVIRFRHRPEKDHPEEKGTPLKNGTDGERDVNIPTELAELIGEYLQNPGRHDVTDRYGREPLLTTKYGRPDTDTIRRDLYKLTRPCVHSNSCPHDRDTDACEAVDNENASKCPSSHSPHPLRRYSIESQIDRGVAKELLTDRVDVSVPVLNKHYDTRSKDRKRKHRLKVYEKLFDGYGDQSETLNANQIAEVLIDEDGMIDPQALLRLQSDEGTPETASGSDGEVTSEITEIVGSGDETTETQEPTEESDDDQLSLSEFGGGPTAVFGPGTVAAAGAAALGSQTAGRLHRELEAMSPGENGITT